MQREVLQDGTGNYISVVGISEEDISEKIFTYQDIRGFLPLEMRRINGQKEYMYNVTGKISLKKYLDRGNFSQEDIRHLFREIFDMGERVQEYLLDSRGVVIQEELLFYDPSANEWEGIYYKDNKQGIAEAVGGLLEYIMEKMNQKDKELVFFVYGMHKLTREKECTRKALREYIDGGRERNRTEEEGTESVSSCQKELAPHIQKSASCSAVRGHSFREIVIQRYLLPAIIMMAGIVLPIILWRMGVFRLPLSDGTDWTKMGAATVFFLAVAGYGAWKTMPVCAEEKEDTPLQYYDERSEENRVCLIPRTEYGCTVAISHFPYRLGIEDADKNKQSYAHLLQEAGTVMVIDEESPNGTFHNDQRLVPWQRAVLHNGDLLRFGDKEYVVEIIQPEYVM